MANEAVKVELFGENRDGDAIRYTCASGTAINKGTLLTFSDPRTVAAHSSVSQPFAGIAAMDKKSDDFSTSITVWQNGVFDLTCSLAVLIGQQVSLSNTANQLEASDPVAASSGSAIVGVALEAGAIAEVINVRVNI